MGVKFTRIYTLLITLSKKDSIRLLAKGLTTNQNATVATQTAGAKSTKQPAKVNQPVSVVESTPETVIDDNKNQQTVQEALPQAPEAQEPVVESPSIMVLAESNIETKHPVEEISDAEPIALENDFVSKPEIFNSEVVVTTVDESQDTVPLVESEKVALKKTEKKVKVKKSIEQEKVINKKPTPPRRNTAPQPKDIQGPGTVSAPQPIAIPCF